MCVCVGGGGGGGGLYAGTHSNMVPPEQQVLRW